MPGHVSPRIDLGISDDAREVLTNDNIISGLTHIEAIPIEYLLTEDHRLINEHLHDSLPLEMSRVAHRHVVPVVPGRIEQIVDVLYGVA